MKGKRKRKGIKKEEADGGKEKGRERGAERERSKEGVRKGDFFHENRVRKNVKNG